jgi:TAT-translocated FGD2 family F420-dependent dehydrogenase
MEDSVDADGGRPPRPAEATFGFVLAHEQFPVPELVEYGIAAEQAGFDAVWASDHFHPWQDNQGHAGFAWTTLAALGQRTARIALGTGVTCPTYRYNPAIVAAAFASLSLLYPGRVFLGVGTGEAMNEVPTGGGWGAYAERAARLVEAVRVIRQLWTGDWVSHDGRYYHLKDARLYDPPPQAVPIYVAAAGPQSMRLAGEHGDGLITNATMAATQELRAAFAEGARAAGKDPAALPILVEHFVVVGDRQEAERWARLWWFEPKAGKGLQNDPDPRSIQRRAETEIPLAEVYGDWQSGEDPDGHVEAIEKLLASGVTHVFVHSPQGDQKRVIDFYAREVLPRLRGSR